jgi:hypothetical protein
MHIIAFHSMLTGIQSGDPRCLKFCTHCLYRQIAVTNSMVERFFSLSATCAAGELVILYSLDIHARSAMGTNWTSRKLWSAGVPNVVWWVQPCMCSTASNVNVRPAPRWHVACSRGRRRGPSCVQDILRKYRVFPDTAGAPAIETGKNCR